MTTAAKKKTVPVTVPELTEKAKTATKQKKQWHPAAMHVPEEFRLVKAATFAAMHGEKYRFQLTPDHVTVDAYGRTVQSPGQFIEFFNFQFATYDWRVAKRLMEDSSYGIYYQIDMNDPTGFWEDEGYIETKTVEREEKELVKSINPNKIREGQTDLVVANALGGIEPEPEPKSEPVSLPPNAEPPDPLAGE